MVLGVSCHPKRDMLASGGLDKDLRNIRIWEMQAGGANLTLTLTLTVTLTRPLTPTLTLPLTLTLTLTLTSWA